MASSSVTGRKPNTNTSTSPTNEIQDLREHTSLWYKVHVLIYDLRNYREIPQAQARLDRIMDYSYIAMPYFNLEEALRLKSVLVPGGKTLQEVIEETLHERLEKRMKKRVESGDYRVCAAHDLAPIFEKAFDIKPRDLSKDKEFLATLEKSGLILKDNDTWNGLPKKSFQKKNKKR